MSAIEASIAEQFKDLSFAETQLVKGLQQGINVMAFEDGDQLDYENPQAIQEKNIIRADLLTFLLTADAGGSKLPGQMVTISGAYIKGTLNLSRKKVPQVITFIYCYFNEPVDFSFGSIGGLGFTNCSVPAIEGGVSRIEGNFAVNETEVYRGIHLDRCVIGGNLTITECLLKAGTPENKQNSEQDPGFALSAISATVKEAVILNPGFSSKGRINFSGAVIEKDLDCRGAVLQSTDDYTLGMTGLKVGGSMYCSKGFVSFGQCRFADMTVQGHIEFIDSALLPMTGNDNSLVLDGSIIRRDVVFAEGTLLGGRINALGVSIDGDLFFTDCTFVDSLKKLNEKIGDAGESGGFDENVKFHSCFCGEFIRIGRRLRWINIEVPETFVLDLISAKTRAFVNDRTGWPAPGNLFIDGFSFEQLIAEPFDYKQWIQWLSLQNAYYPGPYERFIEFCKATGRPQDMIEIAIAKRERYFQSEGVGWLQKLGGLILRWTVGYGYKSHYALIWALIVILIGTAVFNYAFDMGYLVENRTPENLNFSPFMYSVDTFIPILDFNQAGFWLPDNSAPGVQIYHWLHIFLGWFLTTISVLGFSGIVRKS